MKDKKEAKRLMKFAKKILARSSLKKLKKVGEEDKADAIKYAMKARIEREIDYLKKGIRKLHKEGKDVFSIENNLILLESKATIFNAAHHKSDFKKMANLYKKIEKEMKHV